MTRDKRISECKLALQAIADSVHELGRRFEADRNTTDLSSEFFLAMRSRLWTIEGKIADIVAAHEFYGSLCKKTATP